MAMYEDYEDLVERLRECAAEQNGEKTLWCQAADAIDDLIYICKHQAEELRNISKWIPVTERLPKINSDRYSDDLIVCMRRFDGESYYYEKFAGYLTSYNIWYTYQHDSCSQVGIEQHIKHYRATADVIVAWMPMPSLPEPPKEET